MKLSFCGSSQGDPAPAHGADEAALGEKGAMRPGGVSRAAIRTERPAGQPPTRRDRPAQRLGGEARVDAAADGVADDASRPGIRDHGDVGEARGDRDADQVREPEPVGAADLEAPATSGKVGPS